MSRYTLVLPLLCLVACGDTKVDTASAGPSGDATAGKTTPGMFDSSSTSTTGTSSSGGSDTAEDPSMATSGERPARHQHRHQRRPHHHRRPGRSRRRACDPLARRLPRGEKCAAYSDEDWGWNNYKCVPIAPQPGQAGDPCTIEDEANSGVDSCDVDLTCWLPDEQLMGHCVPNCHGTPEDPTCEDPDAFCAISNDSVLLLCLPDLRPPGERTAPAGDVCFPHRPGPVHVRAGSQRATTASCSTRASTSTSTTRASRASPRRWHASECAAMAYAAAACRSATLIRPNACPGVGQECRSRRWPTRRRSTRTSVHLRAARS